MRKLWVLGGAVLSAAASLTFTVPAQATPADANTGGQNVVNPARCAAQGGTFSRSADGSVRSCAVADVPATVVSQASEHSSDVDDAYLSGFSVVATPVTTTTTTAGAKPKSSSSTSIVYAVTDQTCLQFVAPGDTIGSGSSGAGGGKIILVPVDVSYCTARNLYDIDSGGQPIPNP
jgi:hypothetical protein